MFGRRKNRDVEAEVGAEDSRQRNSNNLKRPTRWPYYLLILLALVFFLPNLIGWFGLHQTAINYAAADFRGEIKVEKFTAGWLQPVQLSGIRVVDDQQQLLFEADSIKTSKKLFELVRMADYGEVSVDKPIVRVQVRPGSSNIEEALANYLTPAADTDEQPVAASNEPLPKIQLNIVEGNVILAGTDQSQVWQIDSLNGRVQVGGPIAPVVAEIAARVTPQTVDAQGQWVLQQSGALTMVSQIDAGASHLSFASADVAIQTQQLPLSFVGPLLERVVGAAQVEGAMTGSLQGNYSGTDHSVAIQVEQLNCQNAVFACPALVNNDRVEIKNLVCDGDVQLTPHLISASEFNLNSDIGKLRADGHFDVQQISQFGNNGRLLDSPFEMNGTLDLGQVIRMLPSTLQLHEDLDVKSGTVTFQVNSQNNNDTRRLVVNLDTANLAADRAGQSIVWAKPLRLVGTIAETNQHLTIENVRCESEFLNVEGHGDLREASFSLEGDLQKLTQRVGQFVDLAGTSMQGLLKGRLDWKIIGAQGDQPTSLASLSNSPIQITGDFAIADPVIETLMLPRWAPKAVEVKLVGVGIASQAEDQSMALMLEQGQVQLDIGTERAIATLAQPVANAFTAEQWHATCSAQGNFGRWLAHLQNFVDLGPISGNGDLILNSNVTLGPVDIKFQETKYQLTDLVYEGYGLKAAESTVTGELAGKYVYETGMVEIPEMTVAADSVSARARNLNLGYTNHLQIAGNVAFRANVNRVADWFALSPTDDSIFWFGDAEGIVNITTDADGILIAIESTDINDMAAATQTINLQAPAGLVQNASNGQRQWNALWQDAKVRLTGGVKLNHDFDAVTFNKTAIQASSLSGVMTGTITDLYQTMNVDLVGAWQPDWSQINGLLAEMTGGAVKFNGSKDQQFKIRGPLFDANAGQPGGSSAWVPSDLFANADFHLDNGELLDLAVGQTELKFALNQGVAQISTDGIPFAGGIVKIAPVIDMRTASPEMKIERTRIIDQVQLRPETARNWLKYVAPLVADATSAQGTLTVDIDSATIPLLDAESMTASGTIHMSQSAVGAGPLAEQLLDSALQVRKLLKPEAEDKTVRTSIQIKDQSVPFVVQDGRVYHKQMDFSHKELTIRTSGSVGFDQELQMTAVIPIDDDWVAGDKYLAGLKGQVLTLPITGTVSKPVIDKSMVAQLSKDLVRKAATAAAQNAVQEKLTPKINEYQQKINEKLGGGLNKLQGKLQDGINKNLNLEKLGLGGEGAGSLIPNLPNLVPNQQQNSLPKPDPKELLKGIGNLFN
ncbi:hypothetical protein N9Y42_02275 [Mariniblastus sp.]|nr:hypothetical protein [Mariniblastus sp.]